MIFINSVGQIDHGQPAFIPAAQLTAAASGRCFRGDAGFEVETKLIEFLELKKVAS